MPTRTVQPLSAAIDRLWQPRLSLTACVRCVLSRSTLGLDLTPARRFNHFPATPLCSLSWWFAGSSERLADGAPENPDSPRTRMPGRFVFGGPQSRPSLHWNPGPVHGMMLLLVPDALHALTGLDAERWLNRLVDAAEVLPPAWLAMAEAVQAAADDDARVRLIEDVLDPLWQAARPHQPFHGHRFQDWVEGLALRAATSAPGRSLRQVERRIKRWTGQPLRELRGLGRAERAFFQALADDRPPNWAEVAADTGYADQSHLCRASRRVTGFAPAELRRRVAEDEGFWVYRLWEPGVGGWSPVEFEAPFNG